MSDLKVTPGMYGKVNISAGCGGSEPCGNPNCTTGHLARCIDCKVTFKNNTGLRIHLGKVAKGTVVHPKGNDE